MRDIVFDTETTGLDPADGHRVVELACVELVNLVPTGREFHCYFDPERDMPSEAFAVHGLSVEFLTGKGRFADRLDEMLAFFAGSRLVAHNAEFDIRFLAAELARCGSPPLDGEVVCTLQLARRRFPGAPASLDALCRRFGIDLSTRTKHGALVDTRLLAQVYLELMGGKEPGLGLGERSSRDAGSDAVRRSFRPPRPHAPSAEELAAHEAMLSGFAAPLWHRAD